MTRDGRPPSGGIKAEWSRFDQTLIDVRAGFVYFSPDEVEELVDRAVVDVRRSIRKAAGPQRDDG